MAVVTDVYGRRIVFVQRVDDAGGTSYEVVDRRLPVGSRVVECHESRLKAELAADRLGAVR